MVVFKSTLKLSLFALSLSMMMSGCVLVGLSKNDQSKSLYGINLSHLSLAERKELEEAIYADQQRLTEEKQTLLNMTLTHEIGDHKLQFKPLLARLYASRKYAPLWTDNAAARQLLRDYAAMVASGISKSSATSLETLALVEQQGGLVYDVLLSDILLDYLYYTQNVRSQASNWLYSSALYQAQQPENDHIQRWLSAVENNQLLDFIQSLAGENHLYRQTVQSLPMFIPTSKESNIAQKLAMNAQRLRVIPDFHNGIFVNIPSYKLQYYRDGDLILESRVIVGTDSRRTPVMYSKLSNVVVNPPWNAPIRLINEDLLPKMKADPNYITEHNYSILDNQGNVVDPASIDWESIGNKFPYRVRQAAGDSALGNYKFNMPSSDAIYLHDTPNRGLFNRKNRALSSGCVRVEKSDQLASILLKEAGWTETRKNTVLASKKTTSAPIRSDNPVFLYYVTAWIENGNIVNLPDIYGYDRQINLAEINWDLVKKYLQ
ncbi:TPA: L,D-transpeptidase family protein [Haemophilus influenzae]